eukprot:1297687-Amphidinium_carterae.1
MVECGPSGELELSESPHRLPIGQSLPVCHRNMPPRSKTRRPKVYLPFQPYGWYFDVYDLQWICNQEMTTYSMSVASYTLRCFLHIVA